MKGKQFCRQDPKFSPEKLKLHGDLKDIIHNTNLATVDNFKINKEVFEIDKNQIITDMKR